MTCRLSANQGNYYFANLSFQTGEWVGVEGISFGGGGLGFQIREEIKRCSCKLHLIKSIILLLPGGRNLLPTSP